MTMIHLPGKDIPLKSEYDVIIGGGGPAGFAAALSSGRAGASTLLIERNMYLGGIWTAGLMPWIIDQKDKTGIMAELRQKMQSAGGTIDSSGSIGISPEFLKLELETMLKGAGVTIRYGTIITDTLTNGKKITHIITESKSGCEAWPGRVFIDCTGDGDLAALAGCSFEYANENSKPQPSSLNALIGGVRLDDIAPYLVNLNYNGKFRFQEILRQAGVDPSYSLPSLFHFGHGVIGMMSHHGYQTCAFDADSITTETIRARSEIAQQIEALKNLGGIWKNLVLIATGAQLGIREGRRIHGMEKVTVQYMREPQLNQRPVCNIGVNPDIHSPNPEKCKDALETELNLNGYAIPWGALVSVEYENLLMAGRCISGDFISHSCYRMSGSAVPMGEAAGMGAALSIQQGITPYQIKTIPYLSTKNF